MTSLSKKGAVGTALRGVLSQALVDQTFAREFEDFIRRRSEPVCRRIATELPEWSEGQVEAAADALFGAVLYRLLVRGVSVSEAKLFDLIEFAMRSSGFGV